MSTYVLVPGAGGEAWYWSRVVPLLKDAGHDAIAIDLPTHDEDAGLIAYRDVIVQAASNRKDVTLVAQSMGAFSAPLAAGPVNAAALLLVAPMIPKPGESASEWWSATGSNAAWRDSERKAGRDPEAPFDVMTAFFHDVPDDIRAEAIRRGEPPQADKPFIEPWPLPAWPDVRTRVLVGRQDRLFPYPFARVVARERLGIEPDVIDSGHLPALAKPRELVAWLIASA
jgi:pimeloyl-ACP methyl ester carboxylesterase